jgi:hypothetical protein
LEDVDVAKDVTATSLADGVLGLVDAGDEHAGEDDKGKYHKDETSNELERSEYSLDFDPGLDEPVSIFAAGLSSETLTTDEGAFLPNQSLQLTSIAWIQSTVATLTATFELSLALAVGF